MEAPGVGYYESGNFLASDRVIDLPYRIIVSSFNDQNKGIYLKTSSEKVTVIGQSSKGRLDTRRVWGIDTFMVNEITDCSINQYEYFVVSVNGSRNYGYYNSSVLIVGTRNNTALKLTVTQLVTTRVGDINITLIAGIEYSFVIHRLQTVYLSSSDDLTGTRITTNIPVSVFSGHERGHIQYNYYIYSSYLIEQMPPTVLWGNKHFISPLSNHHSEYAVKVLAASECVLNIYCNNYTNINISLKSGKGITKVLLSNETCEIQSSSKVLVVQFSIGNYYSSSIMTLVPPTIHYVSKIFFSTHVSGYHHNNYWPVVHYINVIVPIQYYQPDMIYLITREMNITLVTQDWKPIKVDNVTKAYATSVNISLGVGQIIHTNKAALMSAIVYGFGRREGYGTTANTFNFISRK